MSNNYIDDNNDYLNENDQLFDDSNHYEATTPINRLQDKEQKKLERLKLRERRKEEFKKLFKIDLVNETINRHVNQQFKLHYLFDLSCLIKAKALYVMLALYGILAISYPVGCYFAKTNAASYSWIYFLISALLIMSAIIMMVYILFIENRTNSIDMYFIGKGYTRLAMFWVKVLAINSVLVTCIFLQSIVLVIFLAVFQAGYAAANFFVANLFGSTLFVIFIAPIVICFAMIKNKIAYAILSFVLLLLTVTSLVPRFSPVDNSPFTYKGSNANNYVKAVNIDDPNDSKNFEVSDTSYISNGKTPNEINPQPPAYTPFMPGEIILSPFIYTYQVSNYNNLDAPASNSFQGNINRLSFKRLGTENRDNQTFASESMFFRALDENIITMDDNQLRERLIPAFVNFFQSYPKSYFDSNTNLSQANLYRALNNLICQNQYVYYFFAFFQAYNNNVTYDPDGIIIDSLAQDTFDRFSAIIDAIESKTSPSFGTLIRICAAGPNETFEINGDSYTTGGDLDSGSTILSSLSAKNFASELNEIYPYGYNLGNRVGYLSPISESDYQSFLNLFNFDKFDDTNNVTKEVTAYCFDAYLIDKSGNIIINTQQNPNQLSSVKFSLAEAIEQSEYQQDISSALFEFVKEYGSEVGNPYNWTIEQLNDWHKFLKRRYDWFNGYINILQDYAARRAIPNNGGSYEKTPLSLFSLNSNWQGVQSFIYTYYGVIKYVPFNQNLLFGAILMVVICIGCWLGLLFINWR